MAWLSSFARGSRPRLVLRDTFRHLCVIVYVVSTVAMCVNRVACRQIEQSRVRYESCAPLLSSCTLHGNSPEGALLVYTAKKLTRRRHTAVTTGPRLRAREYSDGQAKIWGQASSGW